MVGGPEVPLAPLPCTASGSAHSSPAPGQPSSQRDFGSSSKLGKSLSEPRCACTASWLDLCASEIIFQSLYNTQRSTGTAHLQPLRQGKGMTATSVIPSRGEETTFTLFFFSTYAIIALSIIWICLRSCGCPAACSSQITFQK